MDGPRRVSGAEACFLIAPPSGPYLHIIYVPNYTVHARAAYPVCELCVLCCRPACDGRLRRARGFCARARAPTPTPVPHTSVQPPTALIVYCIIAQRLDCLSGALSQVIGTVCQ